MDNIHEFRLSLAPASARLWAFASLGGLILGTPASAGSRILNGSLCDENGDCAVFSARLFADDTAVLSDDSTGRWQVGNGIRVQTDTVSLEGAQGADPTCFSGEATRLNDGIEVGVGTWDACSRQTNQPPQLDNVQLSPSRPSTADELSFRMQARDPDRDVLQAQVEWFVDGQPFSTNDTISAATLDQGSEVFVRVSAFDGRDTSAPLDSATFTLRNGPPIITDLAISPQLVQANDPMSCSGTFVDPDGDSVQRTVEWYVNGVFAQSGPNFDAPTALGDEVRCEVRASDGVHHARARDRVYVSNGRWGGNVLVIVADDLGTDKVGVYAEHPSPPNTPNIDALAASGVLFRHAWASTVCSPTRAQALTGQMPLNTGLGRAIQVVNNDWDLQLDVTTVPEVLSPYGYQTAAIGKWHLGTAATPDHPIHSGFDHHMGPFSNLQDDLSFDGQPQSYFDYEHLDDGVVSRRSGYATTNTVDDAFDFISNTEGPWFVWLAFNAPHEPFHVAPAHLHSVVPAGTPRDHELYASMVEAMDTEIGRLLTAIPPDVREHTTVVFLGDNGTPKSAVTAPWPDEQSKKSMYEGGVRVPFIVTGPMVEVPGSESIGLIQATDIFASIAEFAGIELYNSVETDTDSLSFVPYLTRPDRPSLRTHAVTQSFSTNGEMTPDRRFEFFEMAIRDERFKLIRDQHGNEQLFDLQDTVLDVDDLLLEPSLSTEAQQALEQLNAELDKLPFP